MQILKALETYERENTKKEEGKIKVISLNYKDICNIGYISEKFRSIEELYLNHNSIEKLNGIEQFPFLKILFVKFNLIKSLDQFLLILNKKSLVSLNFIGSPVEKDKNCTKETLLELFPSLIELNDKSTKFELRHLETTPLTSRQQNTVTIMTVTDSIKTNSFNNQSQVFRNSKQVIEERSSKTKQSDAYEQKDFEEPSRNKISQDSSCIFSHRRKSENKIPAGFNHQQTATFAQAQAIAKKNAQNPYYSTNGDNPTYFEMTERFSSSHILPFIADQSQINEQPSFQEKSMENVFFQNTLRKESLILKIANQERKSYSKCDPSYFETKSNMDLTSDLSQITNVFDKHIVNIDNDIQHLATIFHQKSLKERAFRTILNNSGIDKEKLRKAVEYRNNMTLIRVFYAWIFYLNTNRRKEALIHAISRSKHYLQTSNSNPSEYASSRARTHQENTVLQKMTPLLQTSESEKTRRNNYYMAEDFI